MHRGDRVDTVAAVGRHVLGVRGDGHRGVEGGVLPADGRVIREGGFGELLSGGGIQPSGVRSGLTRAAVELQSEQLSVFGGGEAGSQGDRLAVIDGRHGGNFRIPVQAARAVVGIRRRGKHRGEAPGASAAHRVAGGIGGGDLRRVGGALGQFRLRGENRLACCRVIGGAARHCRIGAVLQRDLDRPGIHLLGQGGRDGCGGRDAARGVDWEWP